MELKKLNLIYKELKESEQVLKEKLEKKEKETTLFFDLIILFVVIVFILGWIIASSLLVIFDVNWNELSVILGSLLFSAFFLYVLMRKKINLFNEESMELSSEIIVVKSKHDKLKVEFENRLNENITKYFEDIRGLDSNEKIKTLSKDFVSLVLKSKKNQIEKNYSVSDEIQELVEMEENAIKKSIMTNH